MPILQILLPLAAIQNPLVVQLLLLQVVIHLPVLLVEKVVMQM